MIGYIISFILGANVSLILYACILAGAKSDKEGKQCQKKDITG